MERRRSVPVSRETDSPANVDGGAIFGQPQERKPGVEPGCKDRKASVIGAKVRRVAETDTKVQVPDPGDGSSEVPRVATRAKAMEGGGERPGSRNIDRNPSHAGGTCRSDVGARTPRRRASATSDSEPGCCSRDDRIPCRFEEGGVAPKASHAPEDQANHLADPRFRPRRESREGERVRFRRKRRSRTDPSTNL